MTVKLLNPPSLYDPSPNAYSQLAFAPKATDVAKITVLIVGHDMQKLGVMQAAQRLLFGGHHPAATLIPVPCLALPQMQIEVEAVIALPA